LPGHGHNYRLVLRVRGPIDAETGFVVDLAALDGVVQQRVLARLDHQHINAAVPAFGEGGLVPSSENLARWIAGELGGRLPAGVTLEVVRVEEDESLAGEFEPLPE
jgi:6-pyruvoyltetrahydropterin/6-carboxytetrahydropterin synthase